MKVKLFKVHSEQSYDEYGYENLAKACLDSQSEWEEVSEEEYFTLLRWASEAKNAKEKYSFVVAVEPDLPIKECIADQMKRETERLEKMKEAEMARKLAVKKRQEASKLKKLEKLKKELAALENDKN